MDAPDLMALAKRSAETDLAFLLRAKEEAKARMKADPSQENINAFNKGKAAVEAEMARKKTNPTGGSPPVVAQTRIAAVSWLKEHGFKVAKSKFYRDAATGKIGTLPGGGFSEEILRAYGQTYASPLAREEDKKSGAVTVRRLDADARLKEAHARRVELKLDIESGRYITREEHETELIARAIFFRQQVENFCFLVAPKIIMALGVDEVKTQEVIAMLQLETTAWLDAYARDRVFHVDLPQETTDDADGQTN